MKTIKHLVHFINGYWRPTLLTWAMVFIETVCEILVAFFTQYIVNSVYQATTNEAEGLNNLYMYSGIIAGLAIIAAVTGIMAGYWAAASAAGFAKNLRDAMFVKIQDYSFKNIDHFSTSSIVTRTTTDITNVQNAFMQIIRAVMRAPFMMIFATIMCFVTAWQLAWIFLIIIPIVLFLLLFIAKFVHPTFEKIFTTYDFLNQEVQENVDGIRVVKSFNREEYQKAKFGKVSQFIYDSFIYVERILAFNNPIMQGTVFLAILLISYFCSTIIVASNQEVLKVGTLSTLISYTMMIMMSLMLISMVYVMIIIARNSAERIVEIIEEKPDIVSPSVEKKEIEEGEIAFVDGRLHLEADGKKFDEAVYLSFFKSGHPVALDAPEGTSDRLRVELTPRFYMANGTELKDIPGKIEGNSLTVVIDGAEKTLLLPDASLKAGSSTSVVLEDGVRFEFAAKLYEVNGAISTVKDGQVDFDHVTFEYNKGKPVLHDIDLHFKPGETIGIIGPTGSSKSTLVSLLARLYDVTEGSVKVGGVDVRNYDLKSLRDSVSVVLQKNTLFTGTIRSNLLWGNEYAPDEEIWRACDIAQATPFIKGFSDGLDHPIAEGGTNVSGGQKQRLCIARALLKNPKILILDDSTSACDTHTDALIREGLSNSRKEVTKFIIAQRVLSVRECDHILVMDEGRIIASGNNDELMKNCAVYRELYESQLKGGDFDAAE